MTSPLPTPDPTSIWYPVFGIWYTRYKIRDTRYLHIHLAVFCAVALALPLATVHAQELRTPSCLTETYDRLAHAQRMFRSTVIGQKSADQLLIGAVRYDKQYRAWQKTATNAWKSPASGFGGTTRTNMQVDIQVEFPAQRGILETRKTQTSDLLPSLLQSFRAFQCHTRAICMAVKNSLTANPPDILEVQPAGCIEFQMPRLRECRLQGASVGDITLDYCEKDVRLPLVEHEARLLTLLVSYDAAYRSLLQFAGTFEDFVTAFRMPLLQPFFQAVRSLRTFADIPCFTAQCDE